MTGRPFEKAINGVKKFISHHRNKCNGNSFYISFIFFNRECRVIHSNQVLSHLPEINVVQGFRRGTNFSPPLQKAIGCIKYFSNNIGGKNRILFYTNGYAYYF
jgi:hypothetical protein